MSRSSSSSSSSGSNTPSPSSSFVQQSLGGFNPLAEHPFTSYSGPSHSRSHQPSHKVHVLPHPSALSMDGPVPGPQPQYHYQSGNGGVSQPVPIPAGSAYTSQGSQTHPASQCKPIFVPFRQETSSPDLSDVLRRKRMGF